MSVSRETLAAASAETGFRPETLEKVVRLGQLAHDIARQPVLSRALALKGGTALNLCFGPPRRLSVDLDLNYVASVDRARMLKDRPEIQRLIRQIAEGQGYRLQWSAEEHAGRKAYLRFQSALGGAGDIQIDLNFLFRVPLGEMVEREVWQPGSLERPSVRFPRSSRWQRASWLRFWGVACRGTSSTRVTCPTWIPRAGPRRR